MTTAGPLAAKLQIGRSVPTHQMPTRMMGGWRGAASSTRFILRLTRIKSLPPRPILSFQDAGRPGSFCRLSPRTWVSVLGTPTSTIPHLIRSVGVVVVVDGAWELGAGIGAGEGLADSTGVILRATTGMPACDQPSDHSRVLSARRAFGDGSRLCWGLSGDNRVIW